MVSLGLSPAAASQQDATDLTGKAVIISGGTSGVGRATAHLLAAEGAHVFVFGRSADDLRETIGAAGVYDFGKGGRITRVATLPSKMVSVSTAE